MDAADERANMLVWCGFSPFPPYSLEFAIDFFFPSIAAFGFNTESLPHPTSNKICPVVFVFESDVNELLQRRVPYERNTIIGDFLKDCRVGGYLG